MIRLKSAAIASALLFSSASAFAVTLDVHIQNLTQGIYFTPILMAAHDGETHLFSLGETASEALATMAEGGNIAPLSMLATEAGASVLENPAEGMLAPAMSASASDWDVGSQMYLSLSAMILPSNDGFVGLDAWPIPSQAGTYTIYLNAYDAGSEANDEIINGGGALGTPGIPVDPGMRGGAGATGVTEAEPNETVHIHPGNLGDSDPNGGISDVDSTVHRWLNPIAKLTITVK